MIPSASTSLCVVGPPLSSVLRTVLIVTIAFEKVEQIYQASLVPKEIQIEPTTKKLSSKINRKEISLFDINPLSAREFLLRAQAEDIKSVSFQLPQEQFTQWKEEQKQAIKAEQAPEGPPTSFAQALLRKLNFNNGADSNGAKGILFFSSSW